MAGQPAHKARGSGSPRRMGQRADTAVLAKCLIIVVRCNDDDGHVVVDVTKGLIRVEVPKRWGGTDALDARYALGALAYSLFNLVARESIKGQEWAKIARSPGPRRSGAALTSRERQQRYRARHAGIA